MAKAVVVGLLVLALFVSSCGTFISNTKPSTSTKELFYVPKSNTKIPDIVELKVIKEWEGTQSKDIKFNTTTAPWVINSGYTRTSQLSSIFELSIGQLVADFPGIELMQNTATLTNGSIIGLIEDSGSFIIHIKASGIKWWVKIGIE